MKPEMSNRGTFVDFSTTVEGMGPVDACPSCDASTFVVEERAGEVIFHCLDCSAAWRYELGYLWQVPA